MPPTLHCRAWSCQPGCRGASARDGSQSAPTLPPRGQLSHGPSQPEESTHQQTYRCPRGWVWRRRASRSGRSPCRPQAAPFSFTRRRRKNSLPINYMAPHAWLRLCRDGCVVCGARASVGESGGVTSRGASWQQSARRSSACPARHTPHLSPAPRTAHARPASAGRRLPSCRPPPRPPTWSRPRRGRGRRF